MKAKVVRNNWFGIGARAWWEPGAWVFVIRLGHRQLWIESADDDVPAPSQTGGVE